MSEVLIVRVVKQGSGYAADFVGRAPNQKEWESSGLPAATPAKAVANVIARIYDVADSGRGPGRKRVGHAVARFLANGGRS